jgi:hypothetical protein
LEAFYSLELFFSIKHLCALVASKIVGIHRTLTLVAAFLGALWFTQFNALCSIALVYPIDRVDTGRLIKKDIVKILGQDESNGERRFED